MGYNEELVEEVRRGRLAIKNDGTKKELKALLKYCFPIETKSILGDGTYYFKVKFHQWTGEDSTNLPYKSVKEFYMKKELPENWCIKRTMENDKVVTDFINNYSGINEVAARRQVYEDFKQQFIKFFIAFHC